MLIMTPMNAIIRVKICDDSCQIIFATIRVQIRDDSRLIIFAIICMEVCNNSRLWHTTIDILKSDRIKCYSNVYGFFITMLVEFGVYLIICISSQKNSHCFVSFYTHRFACNKYRSVLFYGYSGDIFWL